MFEQLVGATGKQAEETGRRGLKWEDGKMWVTSEAKPPAPNGELWRGGGPSAQQSRP